jgi:hypothetical protein|tara:strand:+ start:3128 stop:3346 length:219 start_codon:yes stop_codon:yes gene_type:complete
MINSVQIDYIDAHLQMAADAEISADQLMADEMFMLALEADEQLTRELAEATRTALLPPEDHDRMEAIHERPI